MRGERKSKDHVDEGDVNEHASGGGENPRCRFVRPADGQSDKDANEA